MPSGGTPVPTAAPSGSPAVSDLDRLLAEVPVPRRVGARTLRISAVEGERALAADQGGALRALVERLGRDPAAVRIVYGASDDRTLAIVGTKVPGADPGGLLSGYLEAARADTPGSATTEATLGGKQVTHFTSPSASFYVYASGDILYVVSGDERSAGEVFGQLR